MRDLAARTRRLLALGINLDFAPCVDIPRTQESRDRDPLLRNGALPGDRLRARGDRRLPLGRRDPGREALPGHGDTSLDSHVALPRVEASVDQLLMREFRPFEGAIQAAVPVVMTARVLVPSLDPDPARTSTLSHAVVTGLLRERLRFSGVVVTDALEMHGATSLRFTREVAVRAIEAGVDLLLYSKLEPGPDEALQALRAALASGRITADRVAESLSRVRGCARGSAARPAVFSSALEREARDLIPAAELERIAEGAARVMKQGAGGIPLRQPVDVLEVMAGEPRLDRRPPPRARAQRARARPNAETWPRRIEGRAAHRRGARVGVGGAGGDGAGVAAALSRDRDGGLAQPPRGGRLARGENPPRDVRQRPGESEGVGEAIGGVGYEGSDSSIFFDVVGSAGFTRCRANPAARERAPILLLTVAVIAISTVFRRPRSEWTRRATSKPSMPGSPMSSRITSGWNSCAMPSADGPSCALRVS